MDGNLRYLSNTSRAYHSYAGLGYEWDEPTTSWVEVTDVT